MVGFGEAGEQAVVQHRHGAKTDLFGGLGDHDQRTFPFGLAGRELAGCADPGGHVDVVAAGVHDAGFFARVCDIARFRGVGQPSFLDERKRVHVGADHEHWAGAVLHDGDKTVTANAVFDLAVFALSARLGPGVAHTRGDGEAETLHLGGKYGGGFDFLKRQFGIGVEVFVNLAEGFAFGAEGRLGGRGSRGAGGEESGAEGEEGVLHRGLPRCGSLIAALAGGVTRGFA